MIGQCTKETVSIAQSVRGIETKRSQLVGEELGVGCGVRQELNRTTKIMSMPDRMVRSTLALPFVDLV